MAVHPGDDPAPAGSSHCTPGNSCETRPEAEAYLEDLAPVQAVNQDTITALRMFEGRRRALKRARARAVLLALQEAGGTRTANPCPPDGTGSTAPA